MQKTLAQRSRTDSVKTREEHGEERGGGREEKERILKDETGSRKKGTNEDRKKEIQKL